MRARRCIPEPPNAQAATAAYLGICFPSEKRASIELLPLLVIAVVPLTAFVQYWLSQRSDRREREQSLAPSKFAVSTAVLGDAVAKAKPKHLSPTNRVMSTAHWGLLAALRPNHNGDNNSRGAPQPPSAPPASPGTVPPPLPTGSSAV